MTPPESVALATTPPESKSIELEPTVVVPAIEPPKTTSTVPPEIFRPPDVLSAFAKVNLPEPDLLSELADRAKPDNV